jgi:voltage-gated sodium channel
MEQRAQRLQASPLFGTAVAVLLGASAVLIGLEAYAKSSGETPTSILVLDALILFGFGVEIVIRIASQWSKPTRFLRQPWNLFDLALVIAAFIPLTAGFAGVLRMVRVLRVMRIVGRLPRLRMLLTSTILSIPSIFSITALLGIFFYSYSAAGVFLFSDNDPIHFRDPHTAFMSLFRVLTLEDWTDIMYTQIYGCANYGYDSMPELCTNSHEYGPWAALFFMSFVFLGSFIALNLFVGIIIIGMDEARAQVRADDIVAGRKTTVADAPRDLELKQLNDRIEEMQGMLTELVSQSSNGNGKSPNRAPPLAPQLSDAQPNGVADRVSHR